MAGRGLAGVLARQCVLIAKCRSDSRLPRKDRQYLGMSLSPLPLLRVAEAADLWTVTCDRASAADAVLGWRDSGLEVRALRGTKMQTVQGVFDEFSAALQFPSYFGENWPAFDECLSDMDWLPLAGGLVLLVLDADLVLLEGSDELPTLIRTLAKASETYSTPIERGEWWDRPAVPFHAVLQSAPGHGDTTQSRWKAAGAALLAFEQ